MVRAALLAGDAVKFGEDGHIFLGAQFEVGGHGLGDDADGLADVVGLAWTMSKPLTRAVPEVGGTRVVSMRMRVDLPAPLGPSNPKISPCSTEKFKASTATKSPKRLVRFSTSTSAFISAAG